MAGIYWSEIKSILSGGVTCMTQVTVSTDEGVFEVHLDDYENVKILHEVIAAALNAWQRNAVGDAWEKDANDKFIQTKVHSMPPSGPLSVGDVDKFIAWIADGFPEEAPPVG